jgi:hypothetical protein
MLNTLTVLLMLAVLPAQDQERKKVPSDSVEIEARGCLKGRVFTSTGFPDDEGTRRGPDVTGKQFRTSGPKEVMDLVKTHNGHLVEVVGIVRKNALDNSGIGIPVGGGRARVVIGAPGGDPSRMNTPQAPGLPVIDLIALRYLKDSCPID